MLYTQMQYEVFFIRSPEKIFSVHHQFGSNLIFVINMSFQEIKQYITYLPEIQVVVCRLCEICIPLKNLLRHYTQNHTSKKDHLVPMEVRRKVAEYMTTLDLCEPHNIISSRGSIPQLKVIKNGWVCNFPGCDQCSTSESGMLTHYYTHQNHIPKGFYCYGLVERMGGRGRVNPPPWNTFSCWFQWITFWFDSVDSHWDIRGLWSYLIIACHHLR